MQLHRFFDANDAPQDDKSWSGVKFPREVGIRAAGASPELGDGMAEPGNPAGTMPRPDPNEKLVKVFDSEAESEALVVKGLLESGGIDSNLTSAAMVQEAFPGLGGMIILVREEDADAARKLIAEYQQESSGDETAEYEAIPDESTEEPPAKA
jgi:hypothetical protein